MPKCNFDIYLHGTYIRQMGKKAVKSTAKRSRTAVKKRTRGLPKVTPVRFAPRLREGLEMLHGILKTPINKLVNEAVDDLIKKRTAEVATDLEALLTQIKTYRKRDPSFKNAIRQTAEAEMQAIKDGVRDPAEGTAYIVRESTVGPAQSMVRGLLSSR